MKESLREQMCVCVCVCVLHGVGVFTLLCVRRCVCVCVCDSVNVPAYTCDCVVLLTHLFATRANVRSPASQTIADELSGEWRALPAGIVTEIKAAPGAFRSLIHC